MKEWKYYEVFADKGELKRKKKLKNVRMAVKVHKWKMFPLFWNTYRENSKNKNIIYKIKGFFLTLYFYGNIILNKNK